MFLTAIIPLLILVTVVWGCRKRRVDNCDDNSDGNAFDLPSTHFLKGLCALIVVMVHFPLAKGNPLQDAIGSFAYIAVTFFFFVSAYGMQYSVEHNPRYLNRFWINRLAALLVPMLLTNLLTYIYYCINPAYGPQTLSALVLLNGYVRVLLEYCLAFYLLNLLVEHTRLSRKAAEIILIVLVAGSSLIIYLLRHNDVGHIDWPYERVGLIWGLLAYRYRRPILSWLTNRNVLKTCAFVVVGVLLGLAYLKFKTCFFWGQYLLKIVLGLALITLMFLLSARWKFGNPVGTFLGNISYEIYLIHETIMFFIAFFVPSLSSGAFVLSTYAGVIIAAYLVRKLSGPIVSSIKKL